MRSPGDPAELQFADRGRSRGASPFVAVHVQPRTVPGWSSPPVGAHLRRLHHQTSLGSDRGALRQVSWSAVWRSGGSFLAAEFIIIIFIRHMTGQQGMTCTNSGPTKYH